MPDPSSPPPPRPRPPAPGAVRRAPTSPTRIPTGFSPATYAPYAAGVAALIVLVVLMRNPNLVRIGALLIGLVAFSALGYAGISYRINLPANDRLRVLLPIATVVTLLAAAVPYAYTLFPPPPIATVALSNAGDTQSVDVTGSSAAVWVSAEGTFVHGATGIPSYYLTATREGGVDEQVNGQIRARAGVPQPDRHVLVQHGPGHFTFRLVELSGAITAPLHVGVYTRPFSTWSLIFIFGAFAVVALAIDTMLWRRNVEPSYAAAMLLPLVAVTWFQRTPVSPDTLRTDLIATAVIGALGGGLGGEALGRLVRMVVRRG